MYNQKLNFISTPKSLAMTVWARHAECRHWARDYHVFQAKADSFSFSGQRRAQVLVASINTQQIR